ncbi:transcriptional regulator [Lysobacteraceae bacterium NML93-0399]|nr:transcriptional regulator [Xanthomonadaceae bacterium NML93-0399]
MRSDSRLSRMLHVLIHLADRAAPATSDDIATMLDTNPVVVRRTMAGLRDAGYVRSEKGHGGGWSLARPLTDIRLLDIHDALGAPTLFALGLANDDPHCLVERAVNTRLTSTLNAAEALLRTQLAAVTLADIAADVEAGLTAGGRRPGRRRRTAQ